MDRGMGKVYLAGGITGMTFNGCNNWREYAIRNLAEANIHGYNPLRAKDYLRSVNEQSSFQAMQKTYDGFVMSTAKGINTRDHWDVKTSDVVLVNLLEAKVVSIGTVMEIAWAHAYRKPTVLVMESENNLHDHPMIRESVGFILPDLDEALHIVKAILLPYFELPPAPENCALEYGEDALTAPSNGRPVDVA
jgi:nucleoside 2-deoxyribosyltransferase